MRLNHKIVRFMYVNDVHIFGWPSRRQRAVWWLYELRAREAWNNLATQIKSTYAAMVDWIKV